MEIKTSCERLYGIIKTLRSPGGCPWDREQTALTLRSSFLEEVYEVLDAINEGSDSHLKEELGDVIINVAMLASIYEEAGNFSIQDVLDGASEKLMRRHPHVFPDSAGSKNALPDIKNSEQVLKQWDAIKSGLEGRSGESVLDEVSQGLPPLSRAYKLQKKAAKAGFDWPDTRGAREKFFEEIDELDAAAAQSRPAGNWTMYTEEEFGDLVFAAVNWARHLGIDPSVALERANAKFVKRLSM